MKKIFVERNIEAISAALADVDSILKEWKTNDEERVKSTVVLEEYLMKLSSALPDGDRILLKLSHSYRNTKIHVSCSGDEVPITQTTDADINLLNEEYGAEAAQIICDMMQRFSSEHVSSSYSKGINRICITVHRNDKAIMYDTLISLVLAVVSALCVRVVFPADVVTVIAEKFYSPLYDIFLRATMAVIGPMIFFSLAACIANLKDISALGRSGVKIVTCYMLTTFCAILLTLGFNAIFTPGEGTHLPLPNTELNVEKVSDTSIITTLINIIPDNFVGAFANADMLQILFLGIVVGVAATGEGKLTVKLRNGIDVMDHLTQKLIGYCIRLMPISVFGAVGSMVCTLDVGMFNVICVWFFSIMLLLFLMQFVYMALIVVFGHLKPGPFWHKFLSAQISGLSTGSSCATIPITMKCCQKMGISPRLYNFSIPLGASINMDGFCIVLAMSGLFLATLCGIPLTPDSVMSFILTTVLLSVAVPGVSGGDLPLLLVVLNPLGVPTAAATLVMGLLPFCDILCTATNITGDAAVSLIVAKSENLFDKEQYYSKD